MAVLCFVAGMTVGGPARAGCDWRPELLALPDNASAGWVTGGGGEWLAGVADYEGVLWRDGRLVAAGRAFDLPTELLAVNRNGVAVGDVIDTDGRRRAVRYAGGYAYLAASGSSVAWDVNDRGDAVGYDGAALVVWPAGGPVRILDMPTGSVAYGHPALDDDGTVVARTGRIEGQRLRTRVTRWAPDGSRTSIPLGDAADISGGRVVGTAGESIALGWDGRHSRVYRGGARALAVNDAGVVVGAAPDGEPLLWEGVNPTPLPAPPGYYAATATAMNARDAGGSVSVVNDLGTVPVRWRCR